LLAPRAGLSATTLLDGKVLLAGGFGASGDIAMAELYDPDKQTFSTTASMVTARHGHQAFRLLDKHSVLIVGGTSSGKILSAGKDGSRAKRSPWCLRRQMAPMRASRIRQLPIAAELFPTASSLRIFTM